jgi:hypothetical protein
LVACLLNEVGGLKKELSDIKGGHVSDNHHVSSNNHNQRQTMNSNKFPNFNDLRAEDILKQLSINNSDN